MQAPLAYLEQHGVQDKLTQAIKAVLRQRPEQPIKAVGAALLTSAGVSAAQPTDGSGSFLKILTWNIAAVNNNPFEYWLTHPDEEYEALMRNVEDFMSEPGDRDIPVKQVFTSEMYSTLDALMTREGWEGTDACAEQWNILSQKPIISGFLQDKGLGDKRLMSMPDRMTNTVDVSGGTANRPSVISAFGGNMATIEEWWPQWTQFMFSDALECLGKKGAAPISKRPCEMLNKIPRSKYPALSEEEESISLRLQTLCLAIFDAVLVHILMTLSPDGKWLSLKKDILHALVWHKEERQIQVIQQSYSDAHVLFLQEVRCSTMTTTLPAVFDRQYEVICPAKPSKADQNSVILLSTERFGSVTDLTVEALGHVPSGGASIADGDLLVVSAMDKISGQTVLFASFHGDTDGLASAPALSAVHQVKEQLQPSAVVFGLDANTYNTPKPGKQASVEDFVSDFTQKGYSCSFVGRQLSECLTTSNARTFLQPQLQKACKAADKRLGGDFNAKDFLLFSTNAYHLVEDGEFRLSSTRLQRLAP